jgi:nucleoside-diphosphate-sugar epimerase
LKVFLTGATGFVGRHVAASLAAAGHELRCLVRSPEKAAHLRDSGHDLAVGGLLDAGVVRDAVRDVDAVVHVAGLIAARSHDEMRRVNVTGSGLLAAACRSAPRSPRRFVLISSLAAGGPSGPGCRGVREEDPPRPVSRYGASKLDGERAVRRALGEGIELTVLRPPAVYGPHDRGILEFFRIAATGFRVRLGSRARPISIVHGEDLADATRRALETPEAAGRTYYVANRESYAMDDLVARIADAVGGRGLTVRVPDVAIRVAGAIAEEVARLQGKTPVFSRDKVREFLAPGWVCDPSRAYEELRWTPRYGLDEGLRQTADWYRDNRWF